MILKDWILTTHPTQNDLDRAREENKLVIVFHKQPKNVIDHHTGQIWMEGYLTGLGIKRSNYLVIYFMPETFKLSIDECAEIFIKHCNKNNEENPPWIPVAGSKRGIINLDNIIDLED